MTHPLTNALAHPLIALAVLVVPPTALYTAIRALRRAYLRSRFHFRRVAAADWRAWERRQARDLNAIIRHRVMTRYYAAMLPQLLLAPTAGDPRAALLDTQHAVAAAVAARLDAQAQTGKGDAA